MMPWRNLRRFLNKVFKQPGYARSVLIKRAKAYLSYYLGKDKSSYPEAITLFLTHRCNLQCRMCGQWGREGVSKRQKSAQYIQAELTLKELQSIIDDVSSFSPNITLFGGEPLLYHDCIELIKYIKQKGMHCLMITNGSLLENLAEGIVESGLDELNVSLDGNTKLHDQIRGMPGLFDKIMRGLKQINYFKAKKNKRRPFINLQCTITQYNYRFLEQLLDVAGEADADSLTFHNLIFISRGLLDKQREFDNLLGCTSSDWEGFVFDPGIEPQVLSEKIKQILQVKYRFTPHLVNPAPSRRGGIKSRLLSRTRLVRDLGRGAGFSVDFYPNFSYKALLDYYNNPAYMPCEYLSRCLSPWIVAYIFPDGEVRPCLNCSYAYGNIKNDRFSNLWNNRQAINLRRVLKKNKIFPVCVRCTELYRY